MKTCTHYVEREDGTVEICGAPARFNHPTVGKFASSIGYIDFPLCAECYDWVCQTEDKGVRSQIRS